MEETKQSLNDAAIESAAAAIARYIEDHPNASDTFDGVVSWWLARQREMDSVVVVSNALERLIDEGVLSKIDYPGGRTLYSVAQDDQ